MIMMMVHGNRCLMAAAVAVTVVTFARDAQCASTSKFQIRIPKSLVKANGYDHRDSLFGIPPYGGSIQQQVFYTEDKLCSSLDVDELAASELHPRLDEGDAHVPTPFILMVDRGDCTFVHKVRNAQRAGAAAVLIADDTCLCDDEDVCTPDPGTQCENDEPIMADDGSGSDISIPSFLIFKHDADEIKSVLEDDQHVRAEMSFSVPTESGRVEYDLWTTPTDMLGLQFLHTFKSASVALQDEAHFTPHMYVYDGVRAGCHVDDSGDLCYNLCTNAGRYCATDPDDNLNEGVSGADVVRESLRRICIWNLYGRDDGIGKEWWDYVTEFDFRCNNPKDVDETNDSIFFTSDKCIRDAMKHAGVDETKVQDCMDDAGGLDGNSTNSLLEKEIAQQTESGVIILPSAFVNQAPLRGSLSYSTVFKALCSGFASGSEPDVCVQCANCPDEEACVKQGHCSNSGNVTAEEYGSSAGDSSSAVSTEVFIGVIIAIVVVFSVFLFIQHRRQERYMRDQVRGVLAEYMPLEHLNSTKGGMGAEPIDTSVGIPDDIDDEGGTGISTGLSIT